jgi:hypothetical protein
MPAAAILIPQVYVYTERRFVACINHVIYACTVQTLK